MDSNREKRSKKEKEIMVKIKDLKNFPEKYLNREVMLKAKACFLGKSPRGDSFSVNIPTVSEYEICVLKDETGEIFAYGGGDLEIEKICGEKPIIVRGYIKKIHGTYVFKITDIKMRKGNKKSE